MQPDAPTTPVTPAPRKEHVTLVSVIITAALAIAGALGVYLWQQASIDDLEGRIKVLDDKVSQLTIGKNQLEQAVGGSTEEAKVLAVIEATCTAKAPSAGFDEWQLTVGTSQSKNVLFAEDKTFAYVNAGCAPAKKGQESATAVASAAHILKKAPNGLWVMVVQGQDVFSSDAVKTYNIPDEPEFK